MNELMEFIARHPFISTGWLFLLVMLVTSLVKRSAGKLVSSQEATLLVNRQDGIWVDIRDLASYRKGHIAGAHHIPLSQIESGTPTLLEKHQATPIILVCTTGQTAQRAASLLHKQGFTALHVLRGGMSDWQGANLPLAKG